MPWKLWIRPAPVPARAESSTATPPADNEDRCAVRADTQGATSVRIGQAELLAITDLNRSQNSRREKRCRGLTLELDGKTTKRPGAFRAAWYSMLVQTTIRASAEGLTPRDGCCDLRLRDRSVDVHPGAVAVNLVLVVPDPDRHAPYTVQTCGSAQPVGGPRVAEPPPAPTSPRLLTEVLPPRRQDEDRITRGITSLHRLRRDVAVQHLSAASETAAFFPAMPGRTKRSRSVESTSPGHRTSP